MTDRQESFAVPADVERRIRVSEQRRLAKRFQNVGWRDPRLSDSASRQIVFWVASMIASWAPPHNDTGRIEEDGTKWAPLNEPRTDWDGSYLDGH